MGILAELSNEIRKDIRPFADPGTDILFEKHQLLWTQGGATRDAILHSSGGGLPDITIDGNRMDYKSFLASHYMADLSELAGFMEKTIRLPSQYVATSATTTDDHDRIRTEPARGLIAELGSTTPFHSTRIVLVQGEAGSGKTITLKKMTVERAARYAAGKVDSLFFYIDVQGRALSRLDDAMARDLQDLRSRFSYSAVAPLVRRGLLVPVIDGFDELIGAGGYDEAFSSLAAFVSRLDGSGDVIASARSAFFDYMGFQENAERYSRDGTLNYEVIPVQVLPWTDDQADTLVQNIGDLAPDADGREVAAKFNSLRDRMDESNRKLLGKPFYVAQIAKLLVTGDSTLSPGDILPQLVDRFVDREHRKLLGKEHEPLLRIQDHLEFLVRLADEMWWTESRYLHVDDVTAIAELLVEELKKPHQVARQILERVPTYAFLTTAGAPAGNVRFEHDVFYGYLLAQKLERSIADGSDDLGRLLARTIIDETLADQAVRMLLEHANGDGTPAVEAICRVLGRGVTRGVVRENGGHLVARLIATAGHLRPGLHFNNLDFHRQDFGDASLQRPRFENCHFNRVNLTRLRMHSPRFRACLFQLPTVRLGGTLFEDADAGLSEAFQGIVVAERSLIDAGTESGAEYYAPEHIETLLRKMGMRGVDVDTVDSELRSNEVQDRRVRLVQRFLHKMQRLYRVDRDEITSLSFAKGDDWEFVYAKLVEHGMVTTETRPISGRPRVFLRLAYPPDVIRRGENTNDRSRPGVTAFWQALLGSA